MIAVPYHQLQLHQHPTFSIPSTYHRSNGLENQANDLPKVMNRINGIWMRRMIVQQAGDCRKRESFTAPLFASIRMLASEQG